MILFDKFDLRAPFSTVVVFYRSADSVAIRQNCLDAQAGMEMH